MSKPWEKYQTAQAAPQADEGPWSKYAPAPEEKSNSPSLGSDLSTLVSRDLLFGARPAVAGVGGAIGEGIAQLTRNDLSLADRIKSLPSAMGQAFSEERLNAQAEEADAARRNPKLSLASTLGTGLVTAPLLFGKGVQAASAGKLFSGGMNAAKVGAGIGAAQAAGHADSFQEAGEMIATGAGTGVLAQAGGNALMKAAPVVGNGLKYVGDKASKLATKVASNLTGIDEQVIRTYASRADKIKDLLKRSGGDIAEAADVERQAINKELQVTRQTLNNQISKTLENPEFAEQLVPGKAILQTIDDQIKKVSEVTAKFRPDEINELKNTRDLVASFLDDGGNINLKNLHAVTQELQSIAKPAYANGGLIFSRGELAAKVAKGAAAEGRRLVNESAPAIKAANNQLSRLHSIEDIMNRNMLRVGKPEASLVAAGSGNARGARVLKAIDKVTGGSALERAENLAAAKTFGNVSLNPMDYTGKALARMATGSGIGYVTGGEEGALVGAALSSPAALKLTMDAGRFAGRLAQATGRVLVPPAAVTGAGREAIKQGLVKEATAAERHAGGDVLERRIQELQNKRKIK